jgi:osmoprotectant transport system ATP-binding protein
MPQIVLEDVSKRYDGTTALAGVTVSIEDDQTTAVVGPSGSGKSTLLQLINGLERPDGGRVTVFGTPIDYDDLPRLRLRIGYAVQGSGLFPHMTAWDNITLLAKLQTWNDTDTRKRAAYLMDLVGLPSPITREEIHRQFLTIQKSEARTILLVTHDLREAMRLAKRLVILRDGSVVQYDTCERVLKEPADEFVEDLVHSQLETWRPEDLG